MELATLIPDGLKSYAAYFGLVFIRVVFLVSLTPLFGGESAPKRFKTALALLLALVLAGLAYRPDSTAPTLAEFGLYAVKEALIGLVLAVFVRILFDFVSSVGSLVDMVRGSSQALVYDPFARTQQSPLALFQLSLTLALFCSLGGHRMVISALASSLESAPVGPALPARFLGAEGMHALVGLVADLFIASLQLAMPVIVTLFLVDMMLGVTNRVASQIQVFFLGMTFKGLIGLALMMLTLGYTLDVLVQGSFQRIAAFFGG